MVNGMRFLPLGGARPWVSTPSLRGFMPSYFSPLPFKGRVGVGMGYCHWIIIFVRKFLDEG